MEKNRNIPINQKFLLTVEEAAEYFNIGRTCIRNMVKDKEDLALKIGKKVMIKRTLFEKYIEMIYVA